MGEHADRLKALKTAAETWFASEKTRLTNEASFLENILKGRGGSVGKLQDENADGAAQILEDSINDYLGKPPKPKEEQE